MIRGLSGPARPSRRSKQDDAGPEAGVWMLSVLCVLLGFAAISTDLYLPAIPAIAASLGADAGTVELTVASYLGGFCLGQLIWGPLGDRYGRRGPIAAGLVIFIVSSAGCALATDAWQMIGWRILQAAGGSAGVVLARAMVRDLYEGPRAARMLSTLMAVMAIAPLSGPLVGGYILAASSWQMIFWTLTGLGVATLAAIGSLPETLARDKRNPVPLLGAMIGYGALLRDRHLLAFAGAGAFLYGGIYAYIAGTPFAYITYHGVSAQQYGWLFAFAIVSLTIVNILNARLVMRVGAERLMRIGAAGSALAGLAMIVTTWRDLGGLMGLAIPLFVFVAMTGLIIANSLVGAMSRFEGRNGTVAALVGAMHQGVGMVTAGLVGVLADGSPRPMAWIIAACGIGACVCAWIARSDVVSSHG